MSVLTFVTVLGLSLALVVLVICLGIVDDEDN